MRLAYLLGTVAILGSVGCSTPDDQMLGDDEQVEQEDKSDLSGPAYPQGSYRTEPTVAGPSTTITLRADKGYARDTATTHEEGKYQFTKSGSKRYLRLLSASGALLVRYQYRLEGGMLLLLGTGTSQWARYVKAPSWNTNQVSILFPMPKEGEDDLLMGMREGDRALLPEAVFKQLGDGTSELPRLVEAAGGRELYGRLRVTSARIDPCFDGKEPCTHQVRMAAQVLFPLPDLPGALEFSDASIHLFYHLDDAQLVGLLARLHQLEGGRSVTGALGVNPLLAKDGLGSEYAASVRKALREVCSTDNLTRFTFMATGRSKNWFFFILDRGADGNFTLSPIPGIATAGDGFEDHGSVGFRTGNPLGVAWFPDALTRTDSTRALSDADFAADIDQLARLSNPDLVHTADVNCSSCHLASVTRGQALSDRGLTTYAPTPSQFKTATPWTSAPLQMGNMHAFSWFAGQPTVNERTANESQRVTERLAGPAFWDSLSPELRAKLVW